MANRKTRKEQRNSDEGKTPPGRREANKLDVHADR